mgnify:CR=1 FL=1
MNYSFRAVVSYVDSHGSREVLYTSPSESIDNLDDPVQGDVTINGSPREGSVLKAISNSLSDEDGIASINISWEKSKDGRNWIALNSVSGPSLNLNQGLVGFQIRTRVAVVDNFGIETMEENEMVLFLLQMVGCMLYTYLWLSLGKNWIDVLGMKFGYVMGWYLFIHSPFFGPKTKQLFNNFMENILGLSLK